MERASQGMTISGRRFKTQAIKQSFAFYQKDIYPIGYTRFISLQNPKSNNAKEVVETL
jgi:hypothetical protein